MTPVLKCLNWLKINERIKYKLLSLGPTYKVLTTNQPQNLHDLILFKLDTTHVRLWSLDLRFAPYDRAMLDARFLL